MVSERQDRGLDDTYLPKCHDNPANLVWRDLANVGRSSRECDTLSKTNNGSPRDEHTQSMFRGESLEYGTNYDEQASNSHCRFSTEYVGGWRSEEPPTDDRTNRVSGVHTTNGLASWVAHPINPIIRSLHRIVHLWGEVELLDTFIPQDFLDMKKAQRLTEASNP